MTTTVPTTMLATPPSADTSVVHTTGNETITGTKTFSSAPVFASAPTVSAAQSMVRLNTANGYGSTNTRIRRFTTTVTSQGTDITYADSATLGASFTINTAGVYAVSYSDDFTTADTACITLNDSAPTTSPAVGDLLAASTNVANNAASASWAGYLAAGSVIRARSGGGTAVGTGTIYVQFTITRVA